jgi:hypothetical protein
MPQLVLLLPQLVPQSLSRLILVTILLILVLVLVVLLPVLLATSVMRVQLFLPPACVSGSYSAASAATCSNCTERYFAASASGASICAVAPPGKYIASLNAHTRKCIMLLVLVLLLHDVVHVRIQHCHLNLQQYVQLHQVAKYVDHMKRSRQRSSHPRRQPPGQRTGQPSSHPQKQPTSHSPQVSPAQDRLYW